MEIPLLKLKPTVKISFSDELSQDMRNLLKKKKKTWGTCKRSKVALLSYQWCEGFLAGEDAVNLSVISKNIPQSNLAFKQNYNGNDDPCFPVSWNPNFLHLNHDLFTAWKAVPTKTRSRGARTEIGMSDLCGNFWGCHLWSWGLSQWSSP